MNGTCNGITCEIKSRRHKKHKKYKKEIVAEMHTAVAEAIRLNAEHEAHIEEVIVQH